MLRRLVILAVATVIAAVFLLATDQRLLLWETKVTPGDKYEVAGHGDLGKSQTPSLVCRYFTGTGIVTTVSPYSGEGCRFLTSASVASI